jgi:hypothetical protein
VDFLVQWAGEARCLVQVCMDGDRGKSWSRECALKAGAAAHPDAHGS